MPTETLFLSLREKIKAVMFEASRGATAQACDCRL